MFCTNCGQPLPKDTLDCQICGNHVILPKQEPIPCDQDQPETKEKSCDQVSLQDLVDNEKKEILERNQILQLQVKRFKPIGTWSFFLMEILSMIPIINIIVLLIWAFKKNSNINRKSFARSKLLCLLIFVIVPIAAFFICFIFLYSTFGIWIESIINYIVNSF